MTRQNLQQKRKRRTKRGLPPDAPLPRGRPATPCPACGSTTTRTAKSGTRADSPTIRLCATCHPPRPSRGRPPKPNPSA